MTRFTRSANGKYVVKGKSYDILIGTRAQVWHGTAYKTAGGLTKAHIMQNKSGRIVSRSKHSSAKKENRLVKAGYGTKKGHFGFVKLNKSKGKRGGSGMSKPTMGSNSSNSSNSSSSNSGSNSSSSSNNMMKAAVLSKVMGSKSGGSGMSKPTMGSSSSNSSNSSNSGSNSGSSSSNNMMKAAVLSKAMSSKSGGRRSRSRRRRGGMYALSPTAYDGKGVGTSGVNLQFVAGNATS